jgi:iron(III) transport system substrate-binding protein
MFFSRDQEQYADLWTLVERPGRSGGEALFHDLGHRRTGRQRPVRVRLQYPRLLCRRGGARNPDLGIILPRDYTIVTSRIGLVPTGRGQPRSRGGCSSNSSCRPRARRSWPRQLQIAALNPDVTGDNTANAMQELALGNQLRPVPVSPGLMVYLDQVKRARLIKRWNDALRLQ